MKTVTVMNPNHPVVVLNKWKERQKKIYRTLPTETLRKAAIDRELEVNDTTPRKDLLDLLIGRDVKLYKQTWEERTGWSFDDCYDESKLKGHVKEAQVNQRQRGLTERYVELEVESAKMTKVAIERNKEGDQPIFNSEEHLRINDIFATLKKIEGELTEYGKSLLARLKGSDASDQPTES